MKKILILMLVAVSNGVYSGGLLDQCWPEGKSKYFAEQCLDDLVLDKQRQIKILNAKLDVHVLERESDQYTDAFKGLSQTHKQERLSFNTYLNDHCSTYVDTINGGLGTGMKLSTLECEAMILEQRINVLQSFLSDMQ
ncbi:hypothetical protein ND933_13725 [Vibrio diabolicus]|uniref:hypothetical protein n=1 Tax=Vibrio diabolicus TaxID=50719 RepID=UPI00215EA285|nr:hypothetical protein [Vibrio diabolicus]MCS0455062.1 hypothetical protein [Vibrio diabolicus]